MNTKNVYSCVFTFKSNLFNKAVLLGVIAALVVGGFFVFNTGTVLADTVIGPAAISGVTAPAIGATPVTSLSDTGKYTATITWNGTPTTFAASTVYTATITLIPDSGYISTGVTLNFFTVAGATATNAADSGIVTAVFPATGSIQSAVNLGTAGNFVILAKTGISTTGTTSIVGAIGVSPAAATYITGFGPIMDASNTFSKSSLVTGNIYAADYTPPTPTTMTTAISDMQTAYTDAAGRTNPTGTELGAGNIGGMTPGLYKWSSNVTIPSNVTLSGGANDVWIFEIAGNLGISSATQVELSGGAQASNIFWQVAGQTTLGTTSVFYGNILDQTAIVLNTGATLNGRALAQTAVTLDSNDVNIPDSVSVIGVTINNPISTVVLGNTDQLIAAINPTNSTNTNVTWSSSNGDIVTVSSNGLVKAVSIGSATITLTTADGSFIATDSITVPSLSSSGGESGSYLPPTAAAVPATTTTTITPTTIPTIILGCDNRTSGFSVDTGQSCFGNIGIAMPVPAMPITGQVPATQPFYFSLSLKKGAVGNEVVELQNFLNAAGYNSGTADGKFGPETQAAVVKFQVANGINNGYGTVGPLTRALLNK
jgi:hypothetical protein